MWSEIETFIYILLKKALPKPSPSESELEDGYNMAAYEALESLNSLKER